MSDHHHFHGTDGGEPVPDDRPPVPKWLIGSGVILALLVVGLWLYQSGNRNYLVWGLVLLCPLMHLFGHGGHGGHGGQGRR